MAKMRDFVAEVAPLVARGEIKSATTFVDGLENAPAAMMDILRSNANVGKVVIRI